RKDVPAARPHLKPAGDEPLVQTGAFDAIGEVNEPDVINGSTGEIPQRAVQQLDHVGDVGVNLQSRLKSSLERSLRDDLNLDLHPVIAFERRDRRLVRLGVLLDECGEDKSGSAALGMNEPLKKENPA